VNSIVKTTDIVVGYEEISCPDTERDTECDTEQQQPSALPRIYVPARQRERQ